MFSPLSIVIKPSRIQRWLYTLIHALAVLSVMYSSLSLFWQMAICILVIMSAINEWRKSEKTIYLVWDLDSKKLSIALGNGPLEPAALIVKLHMLFGMIYLRARRNTGKDVHLYIFSDSVNAHSYRKLRVAALWGSIKLNE